MKKIFALVFSLLLAFSCVSLAEGRSYTLDEALALVDSGSASSDLLLSDDFSDLNILNSGEYEPAGDGIVVLCRKAPLKEYRTQDEPFADDYEGEDLGEPEVYLCTEIMRKIPYDQRAHSAEEVGDILLVETMYGLSGAISSSRDAGSSLPSMEDLEAVMNEGTAADSTEDEDARFNYRPVFDGYILVSLMNMRTGGGDLIDIEVFPYSELRDNPELDAVWQQAKELSSMCISVLTEGTAPDELLAGCVYQSDSDLEELGELAGNPDSFVVEAWDRIWEKAEELADGDAEASDLYRDLQNAVSFGIPEKEAILAATLTPAREIGREKEIGSISQGKLADFVICDQDLNLQEVYIGGRRAG